MRVELVCPASEDSAHLKSLAIATLAALTPDDVQLSLRDDIVQRLDPERDLDGGADIAAISVSTKTARRAYELAAAYRRHGVKVVMGGIHPTAVPDEALEHCDAVVMGEAEGLWEQVVADARRGALKRVYKHAAFPEFRRPPRPRRSIFPKKGYVPVNTVQASRGCPFTCEFCSVTPFFGRQPRLRDPEDVAEEIGGFTGHPRWVMFADDNVLGYGERSRALFRALAPLRVSWFGQASLLGMQDDESLRLMARSGCRAVFVGFETVSREALIACGKRQNDPQRYIDTVRRLHDHGIAVWGAFVFGFDEDGLDVFEATVDFARKAGILMASFSVLTPYPGTRLFQRLKAEGRLVDDRWWLRDRRDGEPFFEPKKMSMQQLFEGWQAAWQSFYSASSIASRFRHAPGTSLFATAAFLPMNIMQRRLTREKIIGGNRFFLRDGAQPSKTGN
jgi:radical SAM superfamily enzyme YgiQ (UPF0313 family)